jgi:hypothetical protein
MWESTEGRRQLAVKLVMSDSDSTARAGDIQTQVYSRLTPKLDAIGSTKRGVLFDVGHGSSRLLVSCGPHGSERGFLRWHLFRHG